MKRHNSSGFTLIEVLFSIAILGILDLALTTMITAEIKAYKDSKEQFEATLLAQSFYERLKASPMIKLGEEIAESEDFIIITEVEEVEEYEGSMIRVMVEVLKEEKSLERIEGYKFIDNWESALESST